jgi:hypothetical protein
MDTTAIKAAQLRTSFENMKEATGRGLVTALIAASDAINMRFNPAQYAADMAVRDVAKALEKEQEALKGVNEIASRMSGINNLNTQLKQQREEYDKLMATVKTPKPMEGMTVGDDNFLSQRLDWSRDPEIKDGIYAIGQAIDWMDEQIEEWLTDMDEDMKSEFFPNIEKANASVQTLGKSVGVMLVSQFDSLGVAIGESLSGAEGALNSLGQAIMQNLGNLLIMFGFQMGPAGLPLILAGAGMQLGGGIWKGLGSNNDSKATPNAMGAVNFKIKGNDLVGVMDRQSYSNNMNT